MCIVGKLSKDQGSPALGVAKVRDNFIFCREIGSIFLENIRHCFLLLFLSPVGVILPLVWGSKIFADGDEFTPSPTEERWKYNLINTELIPFRSRIIKILVIGQQIADIIKWSCPTLECFFFWLFERGYFQNGLYAFSYSGAE